jgi:hypothetical protein
MTHREAHSALKYADEETARRFEELRRRSFLDLLALPPEATETVNVGGRRVDVTVYRDRVADGHIRVVAQALVKGPWSGLGMRWVMAKGITATEDGAINTLAEPDLHDFL